MAFTDDLDIPIDIVLEGDFAGQAAPPRPATAAAKPVPPLSVVLAEAPPAKALVLEALAPLDAEAASTAAAARKSESKQETLERLLAQVKERRRPRSAA